MKKIFALTLVLVLALGASAMAAEVKVGGEVRYGFSFLPEENSGISDDYAQYRLKASATVNENTSATIWLRSTTAGPAFSDVLTASIDTKFAGLGTLSVGQVPSYGSAPFAALGWNVWSATEGDGTSKDSFGMSFATEKFSGLAAQAIWQPTKDNQFINAEVTYDLPMLEGAFVGGALTKKGDNDMDLAAIFSAPFAGVTVYGEVGKTGAADEMDVKTFGATTSVAGFSLLGEMDLNAEKTYLQVGKSFNGVGYYASYQFGDGYQNADPAKYTDGKMAVWAKVVF